MGDNKSIKLPRRVTERVRRWGFRLRLFGFSIRTDQQLDIGFQYANGPAGPHPLSGELLSSTDRTDFLDGVQLAKDGDSKVAHSAIDCHSANGVWPISFSYPSESSTDPQKERQNLVSGVIPGKPYSYADADSYLDEYRSSYFGITHRKGGWDCFRHLEIMYAGALPLMPDASMIPEFDMIHYPKQCFADLYESFRQSPGRPTEALRAAVQNHFNKHLTTTAMASYVMETAGLASARRILFADANLTAGVDYLSVLTLIGLNQIPGVEVSTLVPVPYIWDDWSGHSDSLYGRGFGYTRVLRATRRTGISQMSVRAARAQLKRRHFDAVVFGSIMRNRRLHGALRSALDPTTTILICGEDLPLDSRSLDALVSTKSQVFVRAIG